MRRSEVSLRAPNASDMTNSQRAHVSSRHLATWNDHIIDR